MTPQERLNQGLYTSDSAGIIGLYEDLIDTCSFEVLPGYAAEIEAAKKIVGFVKRVHNSKEAQVRLAIEAIGKAVNDYDKAMKAPTGTILAKESHAFPFVKQTGNPEYPKLSLIAHHWTECVQKSRAVDIKQASKAAEIEGREKFHTQAEYARLSDHAKMTDLERLREENERARLDRRIKLGELDAQYPALAEKIRAYCLEMWGSVVGKSDRMIMVTYEKALDEHLGWEVPTPAQVRAMKSRSNEIAPLPSQAAKFKSDPEAREKLEKIFKRTTSSQAKQAVPGVEAGSNSTGDQDA